MPARIERKVIKNGDSRSAALPPDWLRAFQIKEGDTLDMIYDSVVLIKPKLLKLDLDFLKKEFELLQQVECTEPT